MPEVEITRRHLEAAMTGRRLTSVQVNHPRTARFNASISEVEQRLEGRTVVSVGRRGKFLVIELDDGHTVVGHLGMSGRFAVAPPLSGVAKHTHLTAMLDEGSELRFIDPRTFGFISVLDEDELGESGLARLGPDAWAEPPTPDEMARDLQGRTASIKALLLEQGIVAGLGNIYADEALHVAGIHPLRPGGDIGLEEVARLLEAIGSVLDVAISKGGTTLGDLAYLLPDGQAGENLSSLRVYGREGEPCPACGTAVERTIVRARSTHYCPSCQT